MFASKGKTKKSLLEKSNMKKGALHQGEHDENIYEPYQQPEQSQRRSNRNQRRQNRLRENVLDPQIIANRK